MPSRRDGKVRKKHQVSVGDEVEDWLRSNAFQSVWSRRDFFFKYSWLQNISVSKSAQTFLLKLLHKYILPGNMLRYWFNYKVRGRASPPDLQSIYTKTCE